jgi:hypothetical protein
MLSDLWNDAVRALGDVLSPHGPAVQAVKSYAPSDYSIHFFLQLAVIILVCRVVGWLGKKFLGQPQVVRAQNPHSEGPPRAHRDGKPRQGRGMQGGHPLRPHAPRGAVGAAAAELTDPGGARLIVIEHGVVHGRR